MRKFIATIAVITLLVLAVPAIAGSPADDSISRELTTKLKTWSAPSGASARNSRLATNEDLEKPSKRVVTPEDLTNKAGAKTTPEPGCALCGVQVLSKDGNVTLTGKVSSVEAKQAAEKMAKGIKGVKQVTNSIIIIIGKGA